MTARKLTLDRRPVHSLVPYPANTKIHTATQVEQIGKSITRFGFNDPIGIKPDGTILEGEGRWQAAQHLGLTDVPVLIIEGLTDREYDLYRIAHNKIALSTGFNLEALVEALREITASDITLEDVGFAQGSSAAVLNAFHQSQGEEQGFQRTELSYDIVWNTKEQKDGFTAFMRSTSAAYPGVQPVEAMLRFAENTGILYNPNLTEGAHEIL